MRAERRAYVANLLADGERIGVEGRSPAAVTDTRIIVARTLVVPPRQGEWTHDSLRFDEIATWRLGRTHDERPIIELEHPVHMRIEHVPAHHFLWWRWGNAEAPIPHTTTRFRFSSDHDPLFGAVALGLMAASVPEGDPFREHPVGTRAERLGGSARDLTLSREPSPQWQRRFRR